MVKFMNRGMTTFSLLYIVKDLSNLNICKMSVLKVLKEREAVGSWRLQSAVGYSSPHDGGDLISNFILIAC